MLDLNFRIFEKEVSFI